MAWVAAVGCRVKASRKKKRAPDPLIRVRRAILEPEPLVVAAPVRSEVRRKIYRLRPGGIGHPQVEGVFIEDEVIKSSRRSTLVCMIAEPNGNRNIGLAIVLENILLEGAADVSALITLEENTLRRNILQDVSTVGVAEMTPVVERLGQEISVDPDPAISAGN